MDLRGRGEKSCAGRRLLKEKERGGDVAVHLFDQVNKTKTETN
jgi:hypothetical protein